MTTQKKRSLRRSDRVEMLFLESVRRRCPGHGPVLVALGDLYTKAGHFQDGLEVDLELIQLCPSDPVVWYNLACSYALTGKSEASFQALEKAIQLGYDDAYSMKKDPDLEAVRGHPKFQELLSRIKEVELPF